MAKPLSVSARHTLSQLGSLLRAVRLQRGMSQSELAERLGVSRHTVSALERGEPKVAIGTAFEAAALLGIPLLTEDEQAMARLSATLGALATVLPARAGRRSPDLDDDF